MTRAEALAFNAGVEAVLAIASRSAAAIAATTARPIAESFAVAALEEIATAGRELLLPIDALTTAAAKPEPAR